MGTHLTLLNLETIAENFDDLRFIPKKPQIGDLNNCFIELYKEPQGLVMPLRIVGVDPGKQQQL